MVDTEVAQTVRTVAGHRCQLHGPMNTINEIAESVDKNRGKTGLCPTVPK